MRITLALRAALAVLALTGPLAATAAGKCERLIATGAPDNPPFLWRDPEQPGRLIGANADLLRQITDALGLKLEILHTGNADEALEDVRSGRVDVLADARLRTERLDEMDFVHPAITELQTLVWINPEQRFYYAGREHLAGHQGVYPAGSDFGKVFDRFAWVYLENLEQTRNLRRAFEDLADGRIEYLLHERHSGAAMAAELGLEERVETLQPPVLAQGMHLAISHDSACNGPWLRGQLALKMTELSAAGVPSQLLADNLERWLAQQKPAAENP